MVAHDLESRVTTLLNSVAESLLTSPNSSESVNDYSAPGIPLWQQVRCEALVYAWELQVERRKEWRFLWDHFDVVDDDRLKEGTDHLTTLTHDLAVYIYRAAFEDGYTVGAAAESRR